MPPVPKSDEDDVLTVVMNAQLIALIILVISMTCFLPAGGFSVEGPEAYCSAEGSA